MKKNRVYAGIDLDALRYNMESMHKNIKEGTKIAAVIKADAYGHGALTVAKTIEDLPYVWGFAVATADEAEMLIADGRKKPILILGISFPEHYELIVEKEIRPAICEYEAAKALSDIAVRKNKTCHIHIKIDTGMSRIGLQVTEDSADLIAGIAKLPNIEIEGIFTHFAQADEYDKTPTQKQIALFHNHTETAGKGQVCCQHRSLCLYALPADLHQDFISLAQRPLFPVPVGKQMAAVFCKTVIAYTVSRVDKCRVDARYYLLYPSHINTV